MKHLLSNRHGLTLIEIILAAGSLAALSLVAAQLIVESRKVEKVAITDLMQLADKRLASVILRRDLQRITPSFNLVSMTADSPSGGFFDYSRSLGCTDGQAACTRIKELAQENSDFIMVVTASDSYETGIYNPIYAYSVSGSSFSFQRIHHQNAVNGNRPTSANPNPSDRGVLPRDPMRWRPNRLYLMKSLTEVPVTNPSGKELCFCSSQAAPIQCFNTNGTENTCPSSPAEKPTFITRPLYFIGKSSCNSTSGSECTSGVLDPYASFANFLHLKHPSDQTINFNSDQGDQFLRRLPPLGDMITRAEILEVEVIKYTLVSVTVPGNPTPRLKLVRKKWNTATENWESPGLTIAENLLRVVFKRPTISLPFVNFEIIHKSQTMGGN